MPTVAATSSEHFDFARQLFLEYEREIKVDLCFQGFDDELKSLPGKYGPPDGCLLLAMEDDRAVGCVALRRCSATECEMKRLYVQLRYRGSGVARGLAQKVVDRGRELGYHRMVLDTLDWMQPAQALYRSLGFVSIEAYYDNPIPGALYFAKELLAS